MKIGVTVIICSILYAFLVSIVYFSKKRIENAENKIYSILIKITLIGLFLELGCCFLIPIKDTNILFGLFNNIVNRAFIIYLATWEYIFTIYMFLISFNKQDSFYKKIRNNTAKSLAIMFYVFIIFVALFLPLSFYNDGVYVYSYGPAANLTYIIGGIGIICDIFCLIKNAKNLLNKKFVPLYILIFLMIVLFIIRRLNPGLIIINSAFSFITAIMFFTIENPDIKLLNEVYRNKELVEQTYEDNSNFIFELTQEVRNPIFNISNLCNEIKSEENINVIKEKITSLNNTVRQLDFIVNDVLNVSTLDVQKVKFVDNRYNLKTLYDDVCVRIKTNIKSDIEFRTSIPNNVPYLYGDSIKLKQILYSLLMNSIKKTEKGFIEFKIDTINKYDVCRVIFTIVDSGSGIAVDKLNEVLSVTGEFDQNDIKELENTELNIKLCQKIIKVLGGNLLIKSKLGTGTEVLLVIDQRIHLKKEDTDLIKYENSINTSRKVLLVSQDKDISKNIKRKLIDNNINVSHLLSGLDAIDKIKSGKKYDFILIEDDMKEITGFTTLKELKKLDKFNIPVIIMLKDNKLSIKDEYIKDGFKDYILLNNISIELDRIIEKY